MKRMKLNALNLGAIETLSREQMKNILGGDDYSSYGVTCGVVIHNASGTVIGGQYVSDGGPATNFTPDGRTKDDAIAQRNNFNNDPDSIWNGNYATYCCDSCHNYDHLFS